MNAWCLKEVPLMEMRGGEAVVGAQLWMWLVVGSVGGQEGPCGCSAQWVEGCGWRVRACKCERAAELGKVPGRIFEIGAHALVCMGAMVAATGGFPQIA
jgi:hypothetical protein